MKKLTSTQVLAAGFAAILGLLVYSAVEAFRLQWAGSAPQRAAYSRFIELDDAAASARRSVWLGGIYSRDYFLNQDDEGRAVFSERLADLHNTVSESLDELRRARPDKVKELGIDTGFERFFAELRELERWPLNAAGQPRQYIEKTLMPRRRALLSSLGDFRAVARQELVDAQARFDKERAAASRTLVILLGAALFFGVLVAFASLRYAIRLERERRAHYDAIALANSELENLSARILEIQEQERRMLARELHDEVGQTLTALRMEISQAVARLGEHPGRERLLRARQLAEKTVSMVRDISLMLRPPLLDDLGLGPALQWQLEQFSVRSGISYVFEGAEVGERLPDDVKTCVFRIAQEALNNCEKYAGATTVLVVLRQDAGRLSLEVRDDGRGFLVDARGLPNSGSGILGMKERALKLGGSLIVDSQPGAGARIELTLPVAAPSPPLSAALEVTG